MPMVMSQFDNITKDISLNIKVATEAAFKVWDKEWSRIIKKETTDLFKEQKLNYEGNGVAPKKTEGQKSVTTRIYEGHLETYTQDTYSFDMPVSWEQRNFAFKNYKFSNQMGMYQSRSINLRYEYSSIGVIDNAYTAGTFAGNDGKAYFANDHTWVSGGTYSNLLTDSDLNKSALEAALQQIASATMEQGIPAQLRAKTIHIGWENIFTLPELLKSNLDPESANNTYNAFQDFGLGKNLNHYTADTDGWWADTQVTTRTLYEAQKPKMKSYLDNPTNNLVENIFASIVAGFHNQLGSHGNQGS